MLQNPQNYFKSCTLGKCVIVFIWAAFGAFSLISSRQQIQEIAGRISVHITQSKFLDRHRGPEYEVSNPICKVLFPSSIQFLQHHKTGTVLNREILKIIEKYCGIFNRSPYRYKYWSQLRWLNFRDTPQSLIKLQGGSSQNIKIHFCRDPVLTIISAFNYHLDSTEVWTSKAFSLGLFRNAERFFDHSTDPQRVYEIYKRTVWTYDLKREPPIWRYRLSRTQTDGVFAVLAR